MKIFRKRILPKVWLSAIAIGVLFLGLAGATVKASDNQTGGFFGLTSVSEYLFGTSTSAALVGDVVSFNPSSYSVPESIGSGQVQNITVTRSGNTSDNSTTTVNYTTNFGSATGGTSCTANVDYITQAGTLTFGPNVVQQTFNIVICPDSLVEGNESFNVTLSNATNGATIGQADATVTIIDDDQQAAGTFAFDAASQNPTVQENVPNGTVVLNVNRTVGLAGTVQVSYTVASGTAVGGASCGPAGGSVDFIIPTPNPGTLTFVAGDNLEQITIQICDDGILEGGENFTVTLNSATNGGVIADSPTVTGNNRSTVTIADGDPLNPGTIQFTSATFLANEGVGSGGGVNTATNQVILTVTRTGAGGATPTGAVSVNYFIFNGSAVGGQSCTAGVDFIDPNPSPNGAPDGTLTFPNGNGGNTQTLTIPITICNNDTVAEVTESFGVSLNNATGGATFGANQAATVLIFDDSTGTVQFSPTTYTVAEGNPGGTQNMVVLSIIRNPGEDVATTTVTVNYTFSGGSAIGGATCGGTVDYINQSGTLTFGPNVTQQFLNVTICPDATFEPGPGGFGFETFIVTLSGGNASLVATTTSANTGTNPPTGTANQAVVSITNDDTAQAGVISVFDVATGTQTNAVTFFEGNGLAPGGSVVAGNRVRIRAVRTTADEDATVVATVTSGTATGGTACTAGVDFIFPTTNPILLTFAAGNILSDLPTASNANSITICNDAVFENNETFTITLSSPNSTSGTASISPANQTLTVTITDNDAQPGTLNLVAQNTNVNESGGTGAQTNVVLVRVTRTAGTNGSVSFIFTLSNGTAIGANACGGSNIDFFNPGPQTITIPDTVAFVDVPVTICNNDGNDTAPNENLTETFNVTITDVTGGAVIGVSNTITVTIQDDAQGTFQVGSPTPVNVSEGVGTQQITVTRVGGSTGTASVTFAFGGTAVGATGDCTQGNGVDYLIPIGNQTLTFGNGVTSQTFNITVCDDALIEVPETILVTIAGTTAGSPSELIGTPNPFTITITDNEAAQTFTAGLAIGQAAQVNEGTAANTTVTFNVMPNFANQAGSSTTFTLGGTATGGAACTAGVDYITPASNTVNFAANSAAAQAVTITVCGDAVVEPNETITLTTGGSTATITILNDDGTVGNASVGGIRVVEDGTTPGSNPANPAPATSNLTVTVNLAGSTNSNAASIQASTANGTAIGGAACTAGVDFVTVNNAAVNFAANATTATFTIQVCNDTVKEANETFFINLSGANNATVNNAQSVVIIVDNDRAYPADFDRDRRTDVSLFRPSNGFFYVLQSINGLFVADQLGQNGDIPTPGDFDNDGASDLAFFRPSTGSFVIRRSIDNAIVTVPFGLATDIPVQGDYNGDGATDVAVFRPSNGTFYFSTTLTNASQNFTAVQFGQAGDIPVPADYDGDFRTDFAVFRNGTFFALRSTLGFIGIQYGQAGDRPVVGDFDGDGRADFTVFRPSGTPGINGGVFFSFLSLTNTSAAVAFGASDDIPAVGDYDGDGTSDVAVFRPTAPARFFIIRSNTGNATTAAFGNGQFSVVEFGLAGDIPLPARYQPAFQ